MERLYKWEARRRWDRSLGRALNSRALLAAGEVGGIATCSRQRIAARTLLFLIQRKMAVRDAIKSVSGAELFSNGVFDWLYGTGTEKARFERWCPVVDELPRRQTRVATWPVVTVFGFIARPRTHLFLKPRQWRCAAADGTGSTFRTHRSRPGWKTYRSPARVRQDDSHRPGRLAPTRHDRRAVDHLGRGVERVRLMTQRAAARIGCSGWSYKDWTGPVYSADAPVRAWFACYAALFDTVEINNTFYRLPAASTG